MGESYILTMTVNNGSAPPYIFTNHASGHLRLVSVSQSNSSPEGPVMLDDEPASHESKTKFASASNSYPSPNLDAIVLTLQHQTLTC